MTDSRVPMLGADEAAARAEELGLPAQLAELHIFRVLLRRPAAAKAMSDLLLALLFRGVLDNRLRELVIMRIGWSTGSDYEWTQHWSIAQETFGCTPEELLAVREWRTSGLFGAREQAVLAATDETLETGGIAAATFDRCRSALGDDDAVLELVLAIGAWRTISQVTRSLAIPLEDGVASWPPDGVAGA